MIQYLVHWIVTFLFSLFIIGFYYFGYSFHIESFPSALWIYFIIIWALYGIYKFITISLEKEQLSFSILHILSLFFAHLFIVCGTYFVIVNQSFWNGLILFFRVLWFLLLPLSLSLLFYCFWATIFQFIFKKNSRDSIMKIFLNFWMWFFVFVTSLTLASFFKAYNATILFILLWWIILVSLKEIFNILNTLSQPIFVLENHIPDSDNYIKRLAPYLLTTEFLFIVSTFLLSVNFINVLRPFPIWWDDLWVYMNFPRLMADAGTFLPLWQMMSWQIFTGIGFLFGSTTQSFFLNSFSWVWTFLWVVLCLYSFWLKSKIINIPLLFWTVYLSLPMVIFHLAKDMKLDQALFAFTIIAIFIVFHTFSHSEKTHKRELSYLLVAWLITGLCFTIKLTSLLLISGLIGVIFFRFLGVLWFLGYVFLYFSVFTLGWFWSFLSVVYPKDDITFVQTTSLVFFALSFALFVPTFRKIKNYIPLLTALTSFFAWIIIAVSPWLVMNYNTFSPWDNVGVIWILNGKNQVFIPDYTLIHTKEFLEKIKFDQMMKASWTSWNEDLWRYFWYEKWLNNYIKLPWNLTMQVNQKWEFTDISYIFLALLPTLFLFYPFKRTYFVLPIFIWMLLIIAINSLTPTVPLFTKIFESTYLPEGYIYIFLVFLFWLFYFLYSFSWKDSKLHTFFNLTLIFWVFYIFLWTIAAFGIVWYGIAMYLIFFILMWFWLYFASHIEHESKEMSLFKTVISLWIFFIFWLYFVASSFPHWMENLKASWNYTYKMWVESENRALFVAHPEYLKILYELNIDEKSRDIVVQQVKTHFLDQFKNDTNLTSLMQMVGQMKTLEELYALLEQIYETNEIADKTVKRKALNSIEEIYAIVLKPTPSIKSHEKVYRVGTFMKYYISDNNSRIYEDSLVFSLKRYFYANTSPESSVNEVISRLKKVWIKYMLADLNAATIDEDPEASLTQRFESLLKLFTSDSVDIVSSDSPCLLIGIEQYRRSQKTASDFDTFMALASVNHQSTIAWKLSSRTNKMMYCYDTIAHLYDTKQITDQSFTFLRSLAQEMGKQEFVSKEDRVRFFAKYVWSGYKVLVKLR